MSPIKRYCLFTILDNIEPREKDEKWYAAANKSWREAFKILDPPRISHFTLHCHVRWSTLINLSIGKSAPYTSSAEGQHLGHFRAQLHKYNILQTKSEFEDNSDTLWYGNGQTNSEHPKGSDNLLYRRPQVVSQGHYTFRLESRKDLGYDLILEWQIWGFDDEGGMI